MKRVICILLILVFTFSMAGCGNENEKKEVNDALQGTWYRTVDTQIMTAVHIYTFKNGECTFDSVIPESMNSIRSTEGTYTVNSKNHTIEIQFNDSTSKSELTYSYDSGNLSLYNGTDRLTKK